MVNRGLLYMLEHHIVRREIMMKKKMLKSIMIENYDRDVRRLHIKQKKGKEDYVLC